MYIHFCFQELKHKKLYTLNYVNNLFIDASNT